MPYQNKTCDWCGKTFLPSVSNQKRCAGQCQILGEKAKMSQWGRKARERSGFVEKVSGYQKEWKRRNKARMLAKQREYASRPEVLARNRETQRKRLQDPARRLIANVRSGTANSLRKQGLVKKHRTIQMVGINSKELMQYLLSLATAESGFTADNYGVVWVADHIKPLAAFDLSQPDELASALHYTNLQPLAIPENLTKSSWWNGKFYRHTKVSVP